MQGWGFKRVTTRGRETMASATEEKVFLTPDPAYGSRTSRIASTDGDGIDRSSSP
jgi:hypothetical protein